MDRKPLTRRVFSKLLGLFIFILVFHTLVMEIVFNRIVEHREGALFSLMGREALWSGLIAFVVALPVAAWAAGGVTHRLSRVVIFARRIASGDLTARVARSGNDELADMEEALNQTAERLGESFTEIESRRQDLAAMLDSMQEGVFAITADGLIRWTNPVMERLSGTQIRTGRPVIHSVRDPELLKCIRTALKEQTASLGRADLVAPGCIFEVSAVPLPSGGALAVLHDVTRIEAAEKSRRDFIANVSHELRTPLTSIQGYVETLIEAEDVHPDTIREFLNIILKNATRMSRLTEDLLALAGVESPDYKLTQQPTKASLLVEDAIDALGGIIVDSEVSLEFAGAPSVKVMADPDAMNQVFGNLIENALKYAKGTKVIRVGAVEREDEVEFFVRDFGPGIASEHLDRIFERFYRVDKARSRDSGGTGLGLAIVKHIVESHGGRIWAESELGQGTTFFFSMPIIK